MTGDLLISLFRYTILAIVGFFGSIIYSSQNMKSEITTRMQTGYVGAIYSLFLLEKNSNKNKEYNY